MASSTSLLAVPILGEPGEHVGCLFGSDARCHGDLVV